MDEKYKKIVDEFFFQWGTCPLSASRTLPLTLYGIDGVFFAPHLPEAKGVSHQAERGGNISIFVSGFFAPENPHINYANLILEWYYEVEFEDWYVRIGQQVEEKEPSATIDFFDLVYDESKFSNYKTSAPCVTVPIEEEQD